MQCPNFLATAIITFISNFRLRERPPLHPQYKRGSASVGHLDFYTLATTTTDIDAV